MLAIAQSDRILSFSEAELPTIEMGMAENKKVDMGGLGFLPIRKEHQQTLKINVSMK